MYTVKIDKQETVSASLPVLESIKEGAKFPLPVFK